VTPSLVAELLGLPSSSLLPELAMLLGCDYTRNLEGREQLIRALGLSPRPPPSVVDMARALAEKKPGAFDAVLTAPTPQAERLLEAWGYVLRVREAEEPTGVMRGYAYLEGRGMTGHFPTGGHTW
jgi:hypothetical protein